MKFLKILIFIFLFFFLFGKKVQAIEVEVNPAIIKNDNFYQLLGSYINTTTGSYLQNFTHKDFINSAKQIIPQNGEPPVMRLYWDLTNEQIIQIINFCKEVNCDPMFAFSDNFDLNEQQIIERIRFIKNSCQTIFEDTNHCLHWDIGNEPSKECYKIQQVASRLSIIIPLIKEEIPNAVIHALELYYYPVTVNQQTPPCNQQCPNYDIGQCIIKFLNNINPNIKIDVVATHWYPYISTEISSITGTNVLNWEGINPSNRRQKMLYPYELTNLTTGISSYTKKYSNTINAVVGIGEFSTVGLAGTSTSLRQNNATWGAAFWTLDEIGIMAEAGIKYAQKHILNGKIIPNVFSTYTFPIIGFEGERLPVSYAYELYAKYFGNKVVYSKSNQPELLNTHASLDNWKRLKILFINKTGNNQNVSLNIYNFSYRNLVDFYSLTIPNGENFERLSIDERGKAEIIKRRISSFNPNFIVSPYTAVIIALYPNCDYFLKGDINCDNKVYII